LPETKIKKKECPAVISLPGIPLSQENDELKAYL
jgi:hypothetical protein